MWLIFLILLLLILLFYKLRIIKNTPKHKTINLRIPPGPPKLPIIGTLHLISPQSHRSLRKLSRKYGPVMLLRLGGVTVVVVSSAEAAKEALKAQDSECCTRPALAGPRKLSYNYLDVAFAPYGEHWREMRRICILKLFSLKSVESFGVVREEETKSLVDALRRSSLSSSIVDLSEKMFGLTAGMTFRAAFGRSFGGSSLEDEGGFEEMVHRAQGVLGRFTASDFFPYFGWIVDRLRGLSAELERSFRELDIFFERVIDEHVVKSENRKGMRTLLA